jgi:hypothetical protein
VNQLEFSSIEHCHRNTKGKSPLYPSAWRTTSTARRLEAETMLRDMAYVLHLTRQVRESMAK